MFSCNYVSVLDRNKQLTYMQNASLRGVMRHYPHCVFHYGVNFVFFVYQLHKSPKIVCCRSDNEWNGGVGLGNVHGNLGGVGAW